MSDNKSIEVWANEDVVAHPDITASGQSRIDLFLVDFFDSKQSVMVHLGPKQALEVIEELQQALLDVAAKSGRS